ncbi:PAS domain-containing protein [Methylobacterium organophilum]|uniref:histidine kinase n=2 Tax=Bacteria TaxID=2 RepID=A0ABQ4TDN4_METOR|nr:PAS domain-containing protein [Methylobacterium organophilum]GJE28506.1 Sensor histidine kinase RcsC [Methylobacterium organophilum]
MNDALAFLAGGGEAARLIRERDWTDHPLGSPESWPEGLRVALSLVLNSPESMILAWGPELHFFFNDTYIPLLGPRISWAMGERFDRVWADGWDQAKPIIDEAFAGRSRRFVDLPWKLDTDRGAADTWWTFSYSRILDAAGAIAGLFIFTNETTARVLGDAALRESEERLRLVVEGAKDHAILTTDPGGIITSWSAGALEAFGWRAEEAIGQPCAILFTPEDRAKGADVRELATAARDGKADAARWYVTKSGAQVYVTGSVHPLPQDAQGRERGFIKVARNETERQQAERRLLKEVERQRLSLQQMPGFAALLAGPDHVFDYVNDAYLAVAGQRDFIGRSVRAVFPELEGQGFFELLDQVYASGERYTARGMPVSLSGDASPRYIDLLYEPIRDDAGDVIGIFVGGYDITEAMRVASALADSEARYRTLFNSIDQGFCIIEFLDGPHGPLSDYVHVEANPAYAAHAGISDVVGQKVREMVPDEAGGWVELYGKVLRTGEPIRFERELVATGRHLELSAFRVEPESRRQVAVLFQDVTARKRAETELHQLNDNLERRVTEALAERKLFADLVEGTDAFVQVVAPDYRWLAVNKAAADAFEEIYGVRPSAGLSMLDLLADLPEHRDAVEAVWSRALAGEEFTEIASFGDPNRERRHYEMKFSVLREPDGTLLAAYQFVHDVTERIREQERLRQAEEALRQSQKMEAVGQLTGGIAHDFNNLLAGISGSLDLMQTRVSQGRLKDIDRYMTAAQGAAKRAAALTHRLLAFSRRQTLDPKPTDVNRLVASMEDLIRRSVGPGITVEVVGAPGLWAVLVDPPQLENALLNLCINARDAMPEGGRITIETANRWLDDRASRERDLPTGQYLSLCVSDSGTGMAPEVIAKAFDPFFTTKPLGQGTGLGLSMVHGFVRQSGGQVRIYSELGQGTTVCLYLPRHYGEVGAEDGIPHLSDAPRAQQGEAVLVIDDEPTVRMLVTEVLEDLGYTAIEAADGPSGLKVLQSDLRIDLLITDVGLPGGMNGRQVADAARVTRPELKVLFITGYAENAAVGNGHLEPGMQVMTKPFVMEALAARIREMIEGA